MSATAVRDATAEAGAEDGTADAIRRAKGELERAVAKAGLANDPLRYALGGIAAALDAFQAGIEAVHRPIDPAALKRLEVAAATGAARRAAELARAHTRRTALLYVGGVLLGMGLAGAGGLLWGRTSVEHAAERTERRLAAAFQDGAEAAEGWAILMENNDLRRALDLCTGTRSYADQSGRKICLLPLYVEAPRRAAPAEERRR